MRPNPLVLLVDDEDEFLEIASVKLQAEHFETVMAQSFRDAVEKAERLLPDLVLSDVYMPPGLSGWDLALALRYNTKTHDIKFAFFTSLRDPWMELGRDRARVMAALGAPPAILSKMDDVDKLADEVAKLLRTA